MLLGNYTKNGIEMKANYKARSSHLLNWWSSVCNHMNCFFVWHQIGFYVEWWIENEFNYNELSICAYRSACIDTYVDSVVVYYISMYMPQHVSNATYACEKMFIVFAKLNILCMWRSSQLILLLEWKGKWNI